MTKSSVVTGLPSKDTGVINKDYYRCITFQPKSVVNNLIKNGVVRSYVTPKRKDKTDFYTEKLKLDCGCGNYPMYAWAALDYCRTLVFPIDVRTLASSWSYHMGFMQMDGCSIIEFNLPRDLCILGTHKGLKVLEGLDSRCEDSIEAVFKELRMDWVVGIYSPKSDEGTGYSDVIYEPVYSKGNTVLIDREICFNGSGYPYNYTSIETRKYYSNYGFDNPVEGLSFYDLSRMMNISKFTELLKNKAGITSETAQFSHRWALLKSEIYYEG